MTKRARVRTRAWTGQLPQQRELGLSGLLAGSEKQLAEMHVTPGSRAEQWRNRHIREGSLAGAGVELRELEHFHYRIARLTRGEIRYGEAAAIIRPLRQRFTAEEVDGNGNVGSRFDDCAERYRREGNRVNQALL